MTDLKKENIDVGIHYGFISLETMSVTGVCPHFGPRRIVSRMHAEGREWQAGALQCREEPSSGTWGCSGVFQVCLVKHG